MIKLWEHVGLPKGVMNLVQGAAEVGEALVAGDVDGVLFTLSKVGKLIHRQLGGRPEVQLALEMGGNNAIAVGADIEPEAAARITFQSAFLSAGQRCTCARRVFVVRSDNSDAHLDTLKSLCDRAVVDHYTAKDQTETTFGPVIHLAAANAVRNRIDEPLTAAP